MSNLHKLILFVPLPSPCASQQDKVKLPTAETHLIPFNIHIELVVPVTAKNISEQKWSKTNPHLRERRAFHVFDGLQVPGQFFSRLWSYGLLLVLGKFLNC